MFKFIFSVTSRQTLRMMNKNTIMKEAFNTIRLTPTQKFQFARKFVFKRPQEHIESSIVEKKNEKVELKKQFDVQVYEEKVSQAMNLLKFNKLDKSLKIFEEVTGLFSEPLDENENIQLGNVYNMIGRIYNKKGEIEKSLVYYYKSLSIFKKHLPNEPQYQQIIAEMYFNIGVIKLNYLIEDLEEDNIYCDDQGNDIHINEMENNIDPSKIAPTINDLVPSKKRFEVTSQEVLDELDKAKEIMNFLIEKDPSNLKKYTVLLKQIHRNYGYFYLNEMEIIKSIEASKEMMECHIKAFGEKNKETIDIGLDISNKYLQFKKFLECQEFTERIINIINSFPNDYHNELSTIHFNMYASSIALERLDTALKHALECLKIKERLYKRFEEEIDQKLDFMDVVNEENKVTETELTNKLNNKTDNTFLNSLENLLSQKINSNNSANPYLKGIYDQLQQIKQEREIKMEMKEKLRKAKELENDLEDNEIEIIKKSDDPKEKYLTIKEQKRFELGYINEKISEIYLKKKFRKDAYYYCFDSLKYYEDLQVSRLHRTYSNLALIFYGSKNYAKCIEFAKKALFSETKDEDLKINNGELYYIIANSYSNLKKFDKALKYQQKAVKFCELLFEDDTQKYAILLEKQAYYNKLTGNIVNAEKNYELAYSLMLNQNINKNSITKLCIIAFEIGSMKYNKNDYFSALKYYDSIMGSIVQYKLILPNYITNTIVQRRKKLFEEAKKNPMKMKEMFSDIGDLLEKFRLKDSKLIGKTEE
jgi:tetratricopeptide (TPR) repeat protein